MPGNLTNSPAEIIRGLLIALGHGADGGTTWPVYVQDEPNSPDQLITVDDTAGVNGGRLMRGEVQIRNGFRIRLRARTHNAGWDKLSDIKDDLEKTVYKNTVSIDSNSYTVWAISDIGSILVLGTDEGRSKRKLFSLNALVSVRAD